MKPLSQAPKPTQQNQAIIDSVLSGAHTHAEAKAGTGKTTNLQMALRAIKRADAEDDAEPRTNLVLVFNKATQVELEPKLKYATVKTLNGFGHSTLRKALSARPYLRFSKSWLILTEQLGNSSLSWSEFYKVSQVWDFCRAHAYVPPNKMPDPAPSFAVPMTRASVEALLTNATLDWDSAWLPTLIKLAEISIEQTLAKRPIIDFSDQIYIPPIFFPESFPTYPNGLRLWIDEAQDLSALNLATIELLSPNQVVSFGDKNQAIYGFRGAHTDALAQIHKSFKGNQLPLSICWRCSSSVLDKAREIVPEIEDRPDAPVGIVRSASDLSPAEIAACADAVICRNNAPLVTQALALYFEDIPVRILGDAIFKQLLSIIRQLSRKEDLAQISKEEALLRLNRWGKKEIEKAKGRPAKQAKINDNYYALFNTISKTNTLASAEKILQKLFSAKNGTIFTTGHKAKGFEWERVAWLSPELIPSKYAVEAAAEGNLTQLETEQNLAYVIITRAKSELIYLTQPED